jgi:hypothetical protein
MNDKQYYTIAGIVFSVIAIAHLGRIVLMMEAYVGGYEIPLWFSGAAVLIAGYLATRGFQAARKL